MATGENETRPDTSLPRLETNVVAESMAYIHNYYYYVV